MTAIGTWSMWTLSRTGVNGDPIVAEVVVRVKYFYIVTLVLNVICAGKPSSFPPLTHKVDVRLLSTHCMENLARRF